MKAWGTQLESCRSKPATLLALVTKPSRRAAKLAARVAISPCSNIVLELHLLHGGLSWNRLQRLLSACLPPFSSRGMINACYMVGSFISDAEKQCSGFLDWSEKRA